MKVDKKFMRKKRRTKQQICDSMKNDLTIIIEMLKEGSDFLNSPVPNISNEKIMSQIDELLDEYNNIKREMEKRKCS